MAGTGIRPFEDQRLGYTWDQQRSWVNPTKVGKGTYITNGVGLAADYDPTQDTYHSGVNGTTESAMQRAYRWANDMVQNGVTENWQNALNFAMAQLSSDWQRGQYGQQADWTAGTNLGWDPYQFRYNEAGAQYNDAIDYAHATRWLDTNGQMQADANRAQPAGSATYGLGGQPPGGGPAPTLGNPAPAPAPAAPAPAPQPIAQPTGGEQVDPNGGGPGLTVSENTALEDPKMRLQYILDQMGYGTNRSRRNFMGLAAAKNVTDYFSDWSDAMGVGTDALQDTGDLAKRFAGYMAQHGGLGNIRNDASAARDRLIGGGETYTDPDMMRLLSDLGNLETVGAGDIFRTGRANRIEDVMSDYRQRNIQGINQPGNYTPQDDVLSYLQANPLYNFITGRAGGTGAGAAGGGNRGRS